MKHILIQKRDRRCFLDPRGNWTEAIDCAQEFPTSLNAVVHCVQNKLDGVHLLVRLDETNREFIVPINDEGRCTARDFAAARGER
jgi:hypothetical protein